MDYDAGASGDLLVVRSGSRRLNDDAVGATFEGCSQFLSIEVYTQPSRGGGDTSR